MLVAALGLLTRNQRNKSGDNKELLGSGVVMAVQDCCNLVFYIYCRVKKRLFDLPRNSGLTFYYANIFQLPTLGVGIVKHSKKEGFPARCTRFVVLILLHNWFCFCPFLYFPFSIEISYDEQNMRYIKVLTKYT